MSGNSKIISPDAEFKRQKGKATKLAPLVEDVAYGAEKSEVDEFGSDASGEGH